jgi:RNA polymerase subunit RPABC4/transcription elongation factor Spt4
MTLETAKICADCESLFTENVCPKCASKVWMWLSRIVGTVKEKANEEAR